MGKVSVDRGPLYRQLEMDGVTDLGSHDAGYSFLQYPTQGVVAGEW